MSRKISDDTSKKMTDALTKMGAEPMFDVADGVKWATYNDKLRELVINVSKLHILFASDDDGKTWRAAFPMLATTNQSGSKVHSKGYVSETANRWGPNAAFDHAALALGRQLCGLADLHASNDVIAQDVATMKAENTQLKTRAIAADAMEIAYMGASMTTGATEITEQMWDALPDALRTKIATDKPDAVPESRRETPEPVTEPEPEKATKSRK